MIKLFKKCILYGILILISLEVLVRIFHLTKDYPVRYVDEYRVEKWYPDQDGYSVTGNRRQNFSQYHINSSGYNSYREFSPSKDKVEIALVGDSFIEGFHQNYYNSIGKKIEQKLNHVEVYEFGYAGYDFADQLHLINAYKETFNLIDQVFIGIKFENDLERGEYKVVQDRMNLESPLYRNLRKIKLLVYAQNIGALDPLRKLIIKLSSFGKSSNGNILTEKDINISEVYKKHLENFKRLISKYGYDKKRFVLFLDADKTPSQFLNYLESNGFNYIDFSKSLKTSEKPTTLIYDKHWNNRGREIVAKLISSYVKKTIVLK